jgi:hypothetical protein
MLIRRSLVILTLLGIMSVVSVDSFAYSPEDTQQNDFFYYDYSGDDEDSDAEESLPDYQPAADAPELIIIEPVKEKSVPVYTPARRRPAEPVRQPQKTEEKSLQKPATARRTRDLPLAAINRQPDKTAKSAAGNPLSTVEKTGAEKPGVPAPATGSKTAPSPAPAPAKTYEQGNNRIASATPLPEKKMGTTVIINKPVNMIPAPAKPAVFRRQYLPSPEPQPVAAKINAEPSPKERVHHKADITAGKTVTTTDEPAPAARQQETVQAAAEARPAVPEKRDKLPVREFVAAPVIGKPAIDQDGKIIHFYSDPEPLVAPPPPDPDFDPEFADFEASRALPVIDAPDGIYDMVCDGSGLAVLASHTFTRVRIEAGDIVALNAIVTNNSGIKRQMVEQIHTPEGVRGVHEIAAFELEPGESASRRIALHISSSVSAGEYKAKYMVRCKANQTINGSMEFRFAIRALPKLQFDIASPTEILANNRFRITGTLKNSGNTSLNIALTLKGKSQSLQVNRQKYRCVRRLCDRRTGRHCAGKRASS